MKKLSRKIISLVLSALMVLTTIPAGVFAADNVPADKNAKETGELIPPAVAPEPVELNNTNFKDEVLLEKLKAYDEDKDNVLSSAEIRGMNNLDLSSSDDEKISDITGLEKITSLRYINLSGNNLTKVDLSAFNLLKEINLSRNCISELKTGENSKLTEIYLHNNSAVIQNLDLRGCPELVALKAGSSPIENLNLSGLTKMDTLDLSLNDSIITADLTNCVSLENCNIEAGSLKKIVLKGCKALKTLNLSGTAIEKTDLNDCTNLTSINLQNSKVKNLDISKCKDLEELRVDNTRIKKIDFSKNKKLKTVSFSDTPIKEADLSSCTELEELCYGSNENYSVHLTEDNSFKNFKKLKVLKIQNIYCTDTIDITRNKALEVLEINYSSINSIDLKNNSNLKSISLMYCCFKSVDLSECTGVEALNLTGNAIETLDLSKNKELRTLYCPENKLQYLDLNGLTKLRQLDCSHNNLAYIDISSCPDLVLPCNCGSNLFYIAGNNVSEIKGFDPDKVSDILNGSLENGKFIFGPSDYMYYRYDIGHGQKDLFELRKKMDLPDFSIPARVVYTGKKIKPEVRFEDNLDVDDYAVTYGPGRVKPGRYYVKVTGKERFKGSKKKYFTIVPEAPSKVTTRLAKGDGNDLYTYWSKVPYADGYNVYYRLKGNNKWKFLARTKKTGYLKKNLSGGKTYQFKVSPYIVRNDVRYNSTAYKTSRATTLKKISKPSVKRVNSKQVRVKWKNIAAESGYQISKSKTKKEKHVVCTWNTEKGNSKVIKQAKGTTYYYRVRAFKKVRINGKYEKVYGMWSEPEAYRMKK